MLPGPKCSIGQPKAPGLNEGARLGFAPALYNFLELRQLRDVARTWRGAGRAIVCSALLALGGAGCAVPAPPWEAANPVQEVPTPPIGPDVDLAALPDPPTPTRVRLGRWLFYDTRLSSDGSVACATCHKPEHAFSQPTAVSTGVGGQVGRRKAPSFVNAAVSLYPHFFWDGRAESLEAQALGPVENPIEMGNTHVKMIETLAGIAGYQPYFAEAFGSPEITKERVAKAIADYERTRMSGNSPYDRWRRRRDATAVSDAVKQGHELFFGKGACHQCHVGSRFTDNTFHNIGIGWNAATKTFSDDGRFEVTKARRRSRRVQDADAARRDRARALHARRLGADAARRGGVLQPRRQREPAHGSEDAAGAARTDRGGDRRAGGDAGVARPARATPTPPPPAFRNSPARTRRAADRQLAVFSQAENGAD